jgi:hypothetical protein
MAGKHRAHRPRRWGLGLVLAFALGCAATAATIAIVATDPRWLRGAIIAALLGAFAPTLLPTLERKPQLLDDELARLRRQIAQLRGELDAHLVAPRAPVPEQRPTQQPAQQPALNLPLIRAAFAATPTNGNGNGHANGHGPAHVPALSLPGSRDNDATYVIDLTAEPAPAAN